MFLVAWPPGLQARSPALSGPFRSNVALTAVQGPPFPSPAPGRGVELGASGLTPVSGGSDQSFPDLQVTGLYAAYSTPDSVATSATTSSSQYLGAPGNKPIALL